MELLFFYFFFLCDWGWNTGLHTYQAGALLLKPLLQSILILIILEVGGVS
jgi:hypothetical protein